MRDVDGEAELVHPADGLAPEVGEPPVARLPEPKATCLALLEKVKRTGQPILVTRRGEPVAEVVPPSTGPVSGAWLGSFASTGKIVGAIVSPAAEDAERDALRS